MAFLERLGVFIAVCGLFACGALFAVNLDSARAVGRSAEQFAANVLAMALWCLGGAALLAAAGGAVVLGLMVWQRRQEGLRQRDGSYPLQRVRVGQATVLVDPNKMIGPVIAVGPQGVVEFYPGGVEAHLVHARERAKVAQLQALAPGDNAIASKFGSMFRPAGLLTAATGKYLAGGWDRQPTAADQPAAAPATPPQEQLTLKGAIERATPEAWHAGQDPATGAIATFDPRRTVHAGVVGSTGTGKTSSVGYALVAQALRTGYHVTIIDPKGGADWSPWAQHAEWHESDPATFPGQVDALWAEHERRMVILRAAGARSLDDPAVGGALPHALVVVEEYGDLIAQLRRGNKKMADATDNTLDRLMRLSRMTGIHMLLIDQYPEEWSQQVMAGLRWLAVFKLGPNQGQKVGEYKADRLPDVGRFALRGREYNSWNAAPILPKLLAFTPRSAAPAIIDGTVVRRSPPFGAGGATSGERATNAFTNGSANGAMNGAAGFDGDEGGRWQALVDAWFAEHPEALHGPAVGISDIARRMAEVDGRADFENYKSEAHRLFHEFRAAVRLANGEQLGVDVSHNER